MKKSWLFRGLGVIGLTAMAISADDIASSGQYDYYHNYTAHAAHSDDKRSYLHSNVEYRSIPKSPFNGTLTIGSYASVYVYFEYGLTTCLWLYHCKSGKKDFRNFFSYTHNQSGNWHYLQLPRRCKIRLHGDSWRVMKRP